MASILLPLPAMRRKADGATQEAAPRPREELRRELERAGLAPEKAGVLADQLERLAGALPAREVRALLDGIVLGQRAGRPATPELHRLLEDFASELKKLDEGLRLLTTFLVRLRDQTAVGDARILH